MTGEEPGKILHEVRREPASHEAFGGGSRGEAVLSLPPVYYGTVDATPLWVCLFRDAWRWGLPDAEVEALLVPMQACLGWMADYGCGTGPFVSYIDESGVGLTNQGWKDSHDAIQFRDGRVATAPLALCEVQGYAYEAAIGGAELLEAFGLRGGDRWREVRRSPRGALQGALLGGRQRRTLSGGRPRRRWHPGRLPQLEHLGHLLGTGLLDEEEAALVARRLGGPDLNSGFGLRTLAGSSAGFNPLGYHTGSVWAHDTAIAIAGLVRTPGAAAKQAAAGLIEGLLDAAESFAYRMRSGVGHAVCDFRKPEWLRIREYADIPAPGRHSGRQFLWQRQYHRHYDDGNVCFPLRRMHERRSRHMVGDGGFHSHFPCFNCNNAHPGCGYDCPQRFGVANRKCQLLGREQKHAIGVLRRLDKFGSCCSHGDLARWSGHGNQFWHRDHNCHRSGRHQQHASQYHCQPHKRNQLSDYYDAR